MPKKKYIKRIKGWRSEGEHDKRKSLAKDQKKHAKKFGDLRVRSA